MYIVGALCVVLIFFNGYQIRKLEKVNRELKVQQHQYEIETQSNLERIKTLVAICYRTKIIDQESYEKVIELCEMLK